MNNYKRLIDGGIDAVVEFKMMNHCSVCAFCDKGTGKCSKNLEYSECELGIRRWLESEYIEPDSWEKLLEDLDKSTYACTYFKRAYHDCACCDSLKKNNIDDSCSAAVMNNVSSRVRNLLEADAK